MKPVSVKSTLCDILQEEVPYASDADVEVFCDQIVKECKKGQFLFVVCDTKSLRFFVRKELIRNRVTEKRGIYSYKGIIVLTLDKQKSYNKYFDKRHVCLKDKRKQK